MSEPNATPGSTPPGDDPRATAATAGKISDDAQAVLDAAKAAAHSYLGGFTALRRLFVADVGLARDSLVRALIYLLVATVMLGTAYLLLTALVVSGLEALGAPWPLAIGIPLLMSVAIAVFSILRARIMLHHADFDATRRQLKRGVRINAREDTPP